MNAGSAGVVGAGVGFALGLALRVVAGGPAQGPVSTASVPDTPAAAPIPTGSTGVPTRWTVPEPQARPPDLERADAVVAALVGDGVPWDDPAEQARLDAAIRAGGRALEAAGEGRLIGMDCQSWPCLAIVEQEGGPGDASALREAAARHIPELSPWQVHVGVPQPDGRTVNVWLLEQTAPDVSSVDPHLLWRKDDLTFDALAPPIPSDGAEAQGPLSWPDWAP